jgi:chemotaxis response regulator CheB
MTTVLLIDYPLAVRCGLRARLSLERDLDIIGEADDAPQGISMAHALEPEVVVIDAETPDLDAAAIVRAPYPGGGVPSHFGPQPRRHRHRRPSDRHICSRHRKA